MRIPERLRKYLLSRCNAVMASRPPDVKIGPQDDAYMHRWHLLPRNRWFNVYLHLFRHSDDDRALHDHPWWNASVLLKGMYVEALPWPGIPAGGPVKHARRYQGHVYLRGATAMHRVLLMNKTMVTAVPRGSRDDVLGDVLQCTTLFITGPRIRDWGFACPKGWVPWQKFTGAATGKGRHEVGPGCGEP